MKTVSFFRAVSSLMIFTSSLALANVPITQDIEVTKTDDHSCLIKKGGQIHLHKSFTGRLMESLFGTVTVTYTINKVFRSPSYRNSYSGCENESEITMSRDQFEQIKVQSSQDLMNLKKRLKEYSPATTQSWTKHTSFQVTEIYEDELIDVPVRTRLRLQGRRSSCYTSASAVIIIKGRATVPGAYEEVTVATYEDPNQDLNSLAPRECLDRSVVFLDRTSYSSIIEYEKKFELKKQAIVALSQSPENSDSPLFYRYLNSFTKRKLILVSRGDHGITCRTHENSRLKIKAIISDEYAVMEHYVDPNEVDYWDCANGDLVVVNRSALIEESAFLKQQRKWKTKSQAKERRWLEYVEAKEKEERLAQDIREGQTPFEFGDKRIGDLLTIQEPIKARVIEKMKDGRFSKLDKPCVLGFGTLKVLGFDARSNRVLYQYIWNIDTMKYRRQSGFLDSWSLPVCSDQSVLFMDL